MGFPRFLSVLIDLRQIDGRASLESAALQLTNIPSEVIREDRQSTPISISAGRGRPLRLHYLQGRW